MAIDEERIKAALGEKLGGFLVAMAGPTPVPSTAQLESRIDEYLRFLDDHLRIERYKAMLGVISMDQVQALAEGFRSLLRAQTDDGSESAQLVAAAVRYFVTPTDLEGDLEECRGFQDDLQVLEFVIQETGLPVEIPAAARGLSDSS